MHERNNSFFSKSLWLLLTVSMISAAFSHHCSMQHIQRKHNGLIKLIFSSYFFWRLAFLVVILQKLPNFVLYPFLYFFTSFFGRNWLRTLNDTVLTRRSILQKMKFSITVVEFLSRGSGRTLKELVPINCLMQKKELFIVPQLTICLICIFQMI